MQCGDFAEFSKDVSDIASLYNDHDKKSLGMNIIKTSITKLEAELAENDCYADEEKVALLNRIFLLRSLALKFSETNAMGSDENIELFNCLAGVYKVLEATFCACVNNTGAKFDLINKLAEHQSYCEWLLRENYKYGANVIIYQLALYEIRYIMDNYCDCEID